MATRLTVYNEALRLIGEQPLAAISDDVPSKYSLDESWEDVVLDSLSRGIWNFALKTQTFSPDATVPPLPGYMSGFRKPDDWLFTVAASEVPDLRDYYFSDQDGILKDSGGFWYTDTGTVTIEFASTDSAEDAGLANWPPLFARLVAANLALDVANRLTQSNTIIQSLEVEVKKRLLRAKSRDARDEKEARVRPGNWVRAQRGYANRLNRERSSVGGQLVTRQGRV